MILVATQNDTPPGIYLILVVVFGAYAYVIIQWVRSRSTTYSERTYRRGGRLVTVTQAAELAATRPPSQFVAPPGFRGLAFGGLWLPLSFAFTGFLWLGTIGSGKTQSFVQFLRGVLELVGLRCSARLLLFDPKREFVRLVLTALPPHVPVYLLNFLDKRSAFWDLSRDFRSRSELLQLAAFLLPSDPKEIQKFFRDAGRALLFALLVALAELAPRRWTLRDLALIVRTKARLADYLSRSRGGRDATVQFLSARSGPDVLATIGASLAKLEIVAACWQHASTPFSVSEFLDQEAVAVMGLIDSASEAQKPLYQLLVKRVSDEVLTRDNPRSFTGVGIDELVSLGQFDLTPLTTKGRSAGACVFATVQSLPALETAHGEKPAKALLDTLLTQGYLRLDADASAEYASKAIGDEEIVEFTWNVGTGADGKITRTRVQTIKARRLVTADEIKTLSAPNWAAGNVSGYFRVADVGTYRADVLVRAGAPGLPTPANTVDYDPRPDTEQELLPFTCADLIRLGVPVTKKTRKLYGVV